MAKVATVVERLNELFDSDPHNDSSIADYLGVSKQTISAWKNGTRSPKRSAVKKISDYYNVPEEWLYGWDMERPSLISGGPRVEWHAEVTSLVDNAIEKKSKEAVKLAKRRQEELKLIKILDSLSDDGREYLLQQAKVAEMLYGGKK